LRAGGPIARTVTRLLSRFERAFCYTRREASWVGDLGVRDERIVHLPHGVDLQAFAFPATRAADDEVRIGYLGRLVPVKGLHTVANPLSRILKSDRSLRFFVAGSTPVRAYAARVLGVLPKESITYLGEVIPPQRFLKQIDVLIVPSLSESASLACLEGMAAGRAIVARNVTPHDEYIADGRSGYLFQGEVDFSAKLLEAIDFEKRGDRSIRLAARQEAARYSRERMVSGWIAACKGLAS